jgi:hypothetical protein
MDENTGRFLRLQADRLAAIFEQMRLGTAVDRASPAGKLIAVAADLLAKAQELDGKGIGPRVGIPPQHRRH